MSADGYVQVPPNSTGAKVDGASVDVAGNTVIRQRIVIADNSASAQYAVITSGALLVQPNAVAISGTALVAVSSQPPVTISGTAQIAGIVQINSAAAPVIVNNISATVTVAGSINATITNNLTISNTPTVVLAGGGANIGYIDKISATVNIVGTVGVNSISATVNCSTVITGFIAGSGQNVNVVDTANTALRVNVVSGSGSGANPVSIAAGTSNIGFINNISATVNVALATIPAVAISGTPSVVLAAGAANIGTLNGISATVLVAGIVQINSAAAPVIVNNVSATVNVAVAATLNVAVATPYTINNISRTVEVTVSTPFTINGISATVTVTTANPYILNIQSSSHGPRMVQVSTTATTTLVVAPGAGFHNYVTMIAVSNAGTNLTGCQIGWSATLGLVTMVSAANGGGFVMNFDPPWKVQSNEAILCRVDPTPGGNVFFNINFFVST